MKKLNVICLTVLLSTSPVIFAEEKIDHSKHADHNQDKGYVEKAQPGALRTLSELPKSGRGREAGYDKRYAMEPTSVNDSVAQKCAKGSRGLVMLDRETLAKCGQTPKGMTKPFDSKKKVDHSGH